jgi:hypothetical protein
MLAISLPGIGTVVNTIGGIADDLGIGGGGGDGCGPDNRTVLSGSVQGVQVELCSGPEDARSNGETVLAAMRADPAFARSVRSWWRSDNPTSCPEPPSDRIYALYAGWVACGGWTTAQQGNAQRIVDRARDLVGQAPAEQPSATSSADAETGGVLERLWAAIVQPGVDEVERRLEGAAAGAETGARGAGALGGIDMDTLLVGGLALAAAFALAQRMG